MDVKIQQAVKPELRVQLSPDLQVSLRVLEMNSLELEQYIREAYESNPFLELEFFSEDSIQDPQHTASESFSDQEGESYPGERNSWDLPAEPESFTEYLLGQLGELKLEDEVRRCAEYLVEALDPSGFFREDPEETAEILGVTVELFKQSWDVVKALDPVGVASATLEECLLYQLEATGAKYDLFEKLIRGYLPAIAQGKYHQVQKELNLREEDLAEFMAVLRKLEPRPSRGFYQQELNPRILPEVQVELQGEYFHFHWMRGNRPELRWEERLVRLFETRDERIAGYEAYYAEEMQKAKMVLRHLEDRENTVMGLIKLLCETQKSFLSGKSSQKTPYSMKDAAQALNVHESTISRAVRGKSMEFNGKRILVKELFQAGVKNSTGEVSKEEVLDLLAKLIHDEDKKKPLSDAKLTALLQERGYDLQRRTVMKYRESLGFGSSTQRKYK